MHAPGICNLESCSPYPHPVTWTSTTMPGIYSSFPEVTHLKPTASVPSTIGKPTKPMVMRRANVRSPSFIVWPSTLSPSFSICGVVALSSEMRCPIEGPDSDGLCWAPARLDSSGMPTLRAWRYVLVDEMERIGELLVIVATRTFIRMRFCMVERAFDVFLHDCWTCYIGVVLGTTNFHGDNSEAERNKRDGVHT